MESKEPYRATRLWNEVISAFQSGMPVKKHRRRMQTYNNCFTASEAVTWLHCYLMNNPNFGPEVTRQQTVNLLQKFLKCHVIECIIVRSKNKEFSDDSHLYRFSPISQMCKPSAVCLIQSPSFGSRDRKVEKVEKSTRSPPLIQKENLPECHFVERKLSADELKLVWKKVTLSRIEKLFPSVLDNLEEKDIDGLIIKHNVSRLSKTGVVCLVDKTDDIPHWVISAMKCLANWPNASGSGSCLPNYPGFEKDVFKVVRDFFINTQVPLLTESLTPLLLKVFCHFTHHQYIDFNSAKTQYVTSMLNTSTKSHLSASDIKTSTPLTFADQNSRVQEYDREATSHGKILLDDPDLMWDYPSTVIYETDFATSNPITRVIASDNSGTNSVGSIESVSTISVCSQSNRPEDLLRSKAPLKAWSSNLYLQDEIKEHISPRKYSQLEFQDSHSLDHFSSGSNVYLCEINDLDTSNLSAKTVIEVEQDNWSDSSKRCNKQGLYYSSSAICAENSSSRINQTPQRTINQSIEKAKEYCEELKLSFQLILLLLPSVNRRQLHLLMRLINKVLKNGKFVLDVQTSMRHYLLETFLPAIVQSDQNRLLLLEVTAFLVDNCEFLFQIPKGLKQEVEDLSRSCFGRQYEEQRVSVSQEALKGLLNSILHDQNITEKERKRKMKQFKENHPDVYYLQFSKEDAAPKPKQTLLDKLAKLRI
ncbi:DEP domain-containing protein 1B-like isoform X2 [Argiope bruennichi]|uniref:DEP domain-containing protein 1B-like isoform X2 n=1 Tax=Argiope bruennichi TaxID=94029 RepID=UPI002493FB99|nr:DEP domain-containing protein 1B-like isoform X2 [Argiope bruennichi]